ncbi:MAG: hypothetical protein RR365_01135 [Bacteroides sp.]
MIEVNLTVNTNRHPHIVDENQTIREFFEEKGVDYSLGTTNLDGSTLMPGDMDRSFSELGITEKCYLTNIAKVDNA